ncbi:MAG: MFS transporter [Anaerolineales bacterium]
MQKTPPEIRENLKFNLAANLTDAAFFGIGWGLGSFGTIIPLFVNQLTSSALLIGLIPAIHAVGWQLPQLFTAGWVGKMRRFKPAVLKMTIHERVPYLGLALAALLLPMLGASIILPLTFLLLIWQGIGSGVTANAWQSMIAKIIPAEARGTFFGVQAAMANIFISLSAVGAGYLLEKMNPPYGFALSFFLAALMMGISYLFIAMTREPESAEVLPEESAPHFWQIARQILRRDANFRWFLVFRVLFQFATMGFAFYIVFGLRRFEMSALIAGFLTAALTISQTVGNAFMGYLGDRLGHRLMLIAGALAVALSSILAWYAPSVEWLYPVFVLAGLANVSFWTIGMAITVQFGRESERPVYIGLSNTLIAPATILAPVLGGWIADSAGFEMTFLLSAIGGVLTALLLLTLVKDPRQNPAA